MSSYLEVIMKICVFTVFICSVVALDEVADQKTLMEPNGASLLQIHNFEEDSVLFKPNSDHRPSKRSVRAESSSKSEENVDDKVVGRVIDNIKQARESELSDDADSSDSGGDRRISTKGFGAEDFERESNPKIHGRYSKESE